MNKVIFGALALVCITVAGLFVSGVVKADWRGWRTEWGPNPNWTGGGNYYSTWDGGSVQQGQNKYVPPCDPNQVSMQVNPQPVYEGQNVTFLVSGSQGSTWIDDQWWGGADCSGTFWGSKQCRAGKAGTYTWLHTWRNTAENDFNTMSNLCSKSVSYTVSAVAPPQPIVQYVPVYTPVPVYHPPPPAPAVPPQPPTSVVPSSSNTVVIQNLTGGPITLESNYDGNSRNSMGNVVLQSGQSHSFDYSCYCNRSYIKTGDNIDYWMNYRKSSGEDQTYAGLICGGSKVIRIRD